MIYTVRDNRFSLMLMYCNLVESVADVDDKLWRCCLGNVLLYQTPTVIQTHITTPLLLRSISYKTFSYYQDCYNPPNRPQ